MDDTAAIVGLVTLGGIMAGVMMARQEGVWPHAFALAVIAICIVIIAVA